MNSNNFQINQRYKRNIDIKSIGIKGQKELLAKQVLVVGAGGLGCGVITGLTSAGIGKLGIIDFDIVNISNLNRQYLYTEKSIGKLKTEAAYEWIKSYSPKTEVKIYNTKLDDNFQTDIFEKYDIVIDCLDSYESKFLLNKICVQKGIPLIHGGVGEFSGQVLTIIPGKTACLNCLLGDADTNIDTPKGIVSPTVSIIASIQTMEAIKFMLKFDDLLANALLAYDGMRENFRKIALNKRNDCSICG